MGVSVLNYIKRICRPFNPWFPVLLTLMWAACTTVKIPVRVPRPAEINLTMYKQIAFGDIQGQLGNEFAAALRERMTASGRFQIVERSRLGQILRELRLSQSDLADETQRARLGRLLSAAALIMGRVDGQYDERTDYRSGKCTRYERGYNNKMVPYEYNCTNYQRIGKALVGGWIEIVDVETGRIIKSKQLNAESANSTYATDETPPSIDGRSLLSHSLRQAVIDFHKTILPWTEVVQVPLRKDSSIPDLKKGIRQAQVGDLAEAEKTFVATTKAVEFNPNISPSSVATTYWNLGLIYTYTWKFDEAVEAFRRVDSLSPSGFDTPAARATVEQMRTELRKHQEQGTEERTRRGQGR